LYLDLKSFWNLAALFWVILSPLSYSLFHCSAAFEIHLYRLPVPAPLAVLLCLPVSWTVWPSQTTSIRWAAFAVEWAVLLLSWNDGRRFVAYLWDTIPKSNRILNCSCRCCARVDGGNCGIISIISRVEVWKWNSCTESDAIRWKYSLLTLCIAASMYLFCQPASTSKPT